MNTIFDFLSLFTSKAEAHVGYVVNQGDFNQNLGPDSSYLLSPLSEPKNILMMVATVIAIFVLYYLAYKTPKIRSWIIAIKTRLDTYEEFVPWILRLSLGIAFIGSSVAGVLLSPIMHVDSFSAIQLVVGFSLLSGFLIVPSAIAGIWIYIQAVSQNFYIAGNLEILFALVVLLAYGSARPGADDIFGIPQIKIESLKKYIPLLLRLGIGGALTFLALYEKVLNPHVSELVVQKFGLNNIIPVGADMWVFSVGMIELAVGLFILIGFETRLVSIIAFLVLVVTFFFFKEDVYSHVTLFGILSALMITGGGICSVDHLLNKRKPSQ
jgi:uncharacterized membrane protein YphA (DoxX/SURF4 family)